MKKTKDLFMEAITKKDYLAVLLYLKQKEDNMKVSKDKLDAMDFSALQELLSGGEYSEKEVEEWKKARGIEINVKEDWKT